MLICVLECILKVLKAKIKSVEQFKRYKQRITYKKVQKSVNLLDL